MSSEYSLHIHARPLVGRVVSLGEGYGTTVTLDSEVAEHTNRERFTLFIKDDRLLEMSLLFHKIAQDLAALLPDVDACCRCVPGTPDDQCAEHGYGAFKIKAVASCPLCGHSSPEGKVHTDCAAYEEAWANADRIPREEAAEHVEPPHRWG